MKKEIIIVSGLPRSGTSMVMQMLLSGGLKILKDDKRKPDSDNPNGYFEYRKVKKLAQNNSWLKQAAGKVLKVVSPLLTYLPPDYRYRVIFMERDLDQVLASQAKMIKRRGAKKKVSDSKIKAAFKKHLKEIKIWLARQPNVETLFVSYQKTIELPTETAKKINFFLRGNLKIKEAVSVVDPSLRRQRGADS
ncbi:MAG: sulfotransferase domain-containing protein [Patescibacteria group bacterium]|nr:sulfotransferase [Patescibacteria group bacterium]